LVILDLRFFWFGVM